MKSKGEVGIMADAMIQESTPLLIVSIMNLQTEPWQRSSGALNVRYVESAPDVILAMDFLVYMYLKATSICAAIPI